jgi:hypothetical protein
VRFTNHGDQMNTAMEIGHAEYRANSEHGGVDGETVLRYAVNAKEPVDVVVLLVAQL